eukprot:COSAG02_NODE_206_length_29144_cov_12.855121_2_plen_57_part_00
MVVFKEILRDPRLGDGKFSIDVADYFRSISRNLDGFSLNLQQVRSLVTHPIFKTHI